MNTTEYALVKMTESLSKTFSLVEKYRKLLRSLENEELPEETKRMIKEIKAYDRSVEELLKSNRDSMERVINRTPKVTQKKPAEKTEDSLLSWFWPFG